MADVRDRAQLILITGLLLAVSFVVFTLLLNTVIYTENLASRGVDTEGREALEYRGAVEGSLGELIDRENDREHPTHAAVRDNFTNGTTEFDRAVRRYHTERGVVTNVSNVTLEDGTLLRQTDPSRDFTNRTGTENWTLATGVSDTRGFEINVTGGTYVTTSPETEAFNVTVEGSSGNRWRLYVYYDGGHRLAVQNGTDGSPTTDVCGPVSTPVRIDLTRGTVDGTACEAIDFGKGTTAPHDISIGRGDRAQGTFHLTVNTTAGVVDRNFESSPSPSNPYRAPAIYSAHVDVLYQSPDLRYRDRVRIAEGEPP